MVKYLRAKKPQFLISALEHANLCALLANSISGENTKTIATVHIPPIEYARNSKESFTISHCLFFNEILLSDL